MSSIKFTIEASANLDASEKKCDCIVAGVYAQNALSATAEALNKRSGGYIAKLLKKQDIQGDLCQVQWLYDVPGLSVERVLLIGCGSQSDITDYKFEKIYRALANALKPTGVKVVLDHLGEIAPTGRDAAWAITQAVLAIEAIYYRFDQFKSQQAKPTALKRVLFATDKKSKQASSALQQAQSTARGMAFCKDLANTPANICHPSYLANEAKKLAKLHSNMKVEALDEAKMKTLGMHSLLSVSQGSKQPAKLIVVHYQGGKPSDQPHVLVGKAVTFDTGGISLKPPRSMHEMKYDMCGGAAVLGTLRACAEMQCKLNVIGIIPATENMPSDRATRPGDVYKTMSGKTVEVLNTDAEGRLILCDALHYAARFKPAAVIDVATLTGACVVALGHHHAGLYSNQEALQQQLVTAGRASMDTCWPMPLEDIYQEQLDSNVADMANIGGPSAGSIVAACFLARFTEQYAWAHLDIAGVAYGGSKATATARPVKLLTRYLLDRQAD